MHGNVKLPELAQEVGLRHSCHSCGAAQRDSPLGIKTNGQINPGMLRSQIETIGQFIWKCNLHSSFYTPLPKNLQAIRVYSQFTSSFCSNSSAAEFMQ